MWATARCREHVKPIALQTVGKAMIEDKKTWMIEAGDVMDTMTPDKKQPATVQVNKRYNKAPGPAATHHAAPPATAPAKRRKTQAPPVKSKLHFAHLLALTYLTGPLAIMLTPRGRREKPIVALAVISALATVGLIAARFGGLVQEARPASVWAWGALAAIAVIGSFTAWARALHLVGREGVPHLNKLPHWLRQGWAISGLGLIAPGSGLVLSGRADRAAIIMWLLGPAVLAAVILANSMGIWQHHMSSGWLASSGPALEISLMIAGGLVALGFLGYVAQALEGMRQVLVEPGLKTSVKGDYYALAVVASVVVMVVIANPVQMAHQLDIGGDVLREEGFQTIPLQLTLAASHLDPGKPEYSMQAMELYAELGHTEKAEAKRADLDRDLSTYVAMVQKEAIAEFGLAQANMRPQAKPRSAVVRTAYRKPAQIAVAEVPAETPAVESSLMMGTMAREHDEQVNATAETAKPRQERVTRALGMPFGLGLPLSDADTSAQENAAPIK